MANTGFVFGSSAASVGTGFDWSSPTNILADDGINCLASQGAGETGVTDYLHETNFSSALSAIGDTDTIDGIVVRVYDKLNVLGSAVEDTIQLIVAGSRTGSNKSTGAAWDGTTDYGGSSDTWTLSLTGADVKATDFGVAIRANKTSPFAFGGATIQADAIAIDVYYTPAAPEAPVNTVAPVATSADLASGTTASVTTGTWTGSPTPTFTYQWYNTDVGLLTGETANTYVFTDDDIGFNVYCIVTGTNTEGNDTGTSNELGPIIEAPPISFVSNALGATNSTTSFSITLPTTEAGDIMILEFTHRGTGDGTIGGTSISTGGLTWALKHSQLYNSSTFSGKTYWTRATGNHSGQTVTGSGLTNSCAAIVTVYRGAISTGDPLADATVVGEQNASGNETQAEITTSSNRAWVVLVVANSPDLDVSSQSSTDPSVLVERAERLSTGGIDTSISHASAEKMTAGATGAFTWSQSNAASGSWAYAIRPPQPPPAANTTTVVNSLMMMGSGI